MDKEEKTPKEVNFNYFSNSKILHEIIQILLC